VCRTTGACALRWDYGLEGTLTDSLAGSIIRNIMTPRVQEGDYNSGRRGGVKAILDLLKKGRSPLTNPAQGQASQTSSGFHIDAPDMPIIVANPLRPFIFGIIGLFTAIGPS